MEKVVQENKKPVDYRYERKFIVTNKSRAEVEHSLKLHSAFFKEIFHERYINNIYFDYYNYKNYFENVDGSPIRFKARLRWYGDLFGNIKSPILEYKIKKGVVGTKMLFPFYDFAFDKTFTFNTFLKTLKKSDLPEIVKKQLLNSQPTLLNRYRRKYFISADAKFRVTIDDNLNYYRINNLNNPFISKHEDKFNIIIELKYNKEFDNLADEISNNLLFRVSKNSKYVTGVESFFN